MLELLQNERGCTGYGVELDDANVLACARRGVEVLQLNLDQGLTLFGDQSFDVVLQIDTLQHLRNAETMLRETARVGRIGIVAFPNFAHWPNRWSVMRGRMPVTRRLPYQWYNTPNVHLFTISDFQAFCDAHAIRVLERIVLHNGRRIAFAPNLRGSLAVFRFEKA